MDADESDDEGQLVVAQLMLDEARRALDEQRSTLERVRDRAGAIMSFAGAVAALFTGLGELGDAGTWIGLGFFAVVAVMSGAVLVPTTFHYAISPRTIRSQIGSVAGDRHMIESLADAHWQSVEKNREQVTTLHGLYFLGLCAFLAEVLSFGLAVVLN